MRNTFCCGINKSHIMTDEGKSSELFLVLSYLPVNDDLLSL